MGLITPNDWCASAEAGDTARFWPPKRDRLDQVLPGPVFTENKEAKMAMTSLSLGSHWEDFLKREIASGRYASASEVLRAALHALEERGLRLKALQDHLAEGAGQARREEFSEFSVLDVLERAKARLANGEKV